MLSCAYVAAVADYAVGRGYTDAVNLRLGWCLSAPCYLLRDPVKRVQVVSIIARAFIRTSQHPTGVWERVAANPAQYTNVPDTGTQRSVSRLLYGWSV